MIFGSGLIPVLLFAMICQWMVKSRYNKYSRVMSQTGMTGADAAWRLLQLNGITDVKIKRISGTLTDHYDPTNKEICLSEGVFDSRSIAAIGIACHEAGHACQHAEGYAPLRFRNAVIPITRIGSWLGIPLCLIGIYLADISRTASDLGQTIALIGLILYLFVAFFQLVTLPVEFNASHRALATIRANNFLIGAEYDGAKKVLTAAALTYVAALLSSLRVVLILLRNMRRFSR
ncbi:MAG: zinc metallopeptidase [Eubacterium sp.]|nr:zinc metallopeptidase [Eubacterium sp.]